MTDSNFDIIHPIICIFIGTYKFIVSVLEIIFLAIYYKYHDTCYDVWNWIIAATIFDIISCIICFGNVISMWKNNEGSRMWKLAHLAHLLQIIIAIWSARTYFKLKFNTNDSCYEYWNINASDLWSLLLVHFAELWITFIILLIACCCCFLYVSLKYYKKIFEGIFKAG